MNGNCTLIPGDVARKLGNLEPRFQHHYGDVDYRARRAGFSIHVAPGFLGTCSGNSINGTWRDRSISVRRRWRDLLSSRGTVLVSGCYIHAETTVIYGLATL